MQNLSTTTNMDAHQESSPNPFAMDTDCTNCSGLCETREQVVHGYGDVGAEFLFSASRPQSALTSPVSPLPARTSANCSTSSPRSRVFGPGRRQAAATDPSDVRHPSTPSRREATDEEVVTASRISTARYG